MAICLVVVILAEDLQSGVGVQLAQVLLAHAQACRPCRRPDLQRLRTDALGAQASAESGVKQEIHHQPDDFARSEMVTGRLVGGFVESPDEVLEDQPHLMVRHFVRVQVDLGELLDDKEQPVSLRQLRDLLLELEDTRRFAAPSTEKLLM